MCIVICTLLLSRPARGAWVEISSDISTKRECLWSRPARGAWVEIIIIVMLSILVILVAPRKGRVG